MHKSSLATAWPRTHAAGKSQRRSAAWRTEQALQVKPHDLQSFTAVHPAHRPTSHVSSPSTEGQAWRGGRAAGRAHLLRVRRGAARLHQKLELRHRNAAAVQDEVHRVADLELRARFVSSYSHGNDVSASAPSQSPRPLHASSHTWAGPGVKRGHALHTQAQGRG